MKVEAETLALEGDPLVNRPLTTHVNYRRWSALANAHDYGIVQGDIANHRVPIVSWDCGDDMTLKPNGDKLNLVDIANGLADPDLAKIAAALANLKNTSGGSYPILLRHFWEMNRNAAGQDPLYENPDAPDNDKCFLKQGASTGIPAESIAPDLPTQFKDAWIHIYKTLAINSNPRPNVSFVWNPSVMGSAMINDGNNAIESSYFYPGNPFVDWIAADGYDRVSKTSNLPEGYAAVTWAFTAGSTGGLGAFGAAINSQFFINTISGT